MAGGQSRYYPDLTEANVIAANLSGADPTSATPLPQGSPQYRILLLRPKYPIAVLFKSFTED